MNLAPIGPSWSFLVEESFGGSTLRVIDFALVYIFRVQYHPDVNKQEGAEEKFKEIANAYEVRL